MKSIAIGFTEMKGKAKATGNDYCITSLKVLKPAEGISRENLQRVCAGWEVIEIPVAESQRQAFLNVQYPCHLELEIDYRMRGRGIEPIIVGIKGSPKVISVSEPTDSPDVLKTPRVA